MTGREGDQLRLPEVGGADPYPRVRRVRRSVDSQLKAQRALGHLEPVDDGLIGVARTLADALDAEWAGSTDPSSFTIATLAGRLVPVLLELRGGARDAGSGWDEDFERLRAEIRDAAIARRPRLDG